MKSSPPAPNPASPPRSTTIRRGAVVPRGGDAGLGAGGEDFIKDPVIEAAVVDAAVVQAPAAPLAVEQVERFLGAEMQPNPRLGVPANLYVTISPDPVVVPDHAAAAALNAPVALHANRPLKVEAIGLRNCQVLEPTVQEVDPTDPDEVVLKFRVRGTAAGNATVLVEARQNNATLATFTLEPVFVDAVPTPLRAQATLAAAPAVRPGRMVLRIYEFPDANALQFNLTSDDPEIAELQLHRIDARVSLRDHAGAVLAAVEKAWNLRQGGNRQEIYKSFVERLQSDALIRTRDLVPEPIRRLLWRHRDAITSIQVISNEPYIPWELMCLGDPDGPGRDSRFLAEWGLTRWLHNAPLGRKRRPFAAGTLNYVIPDYADPKMALKGAAEEKAMLGNAFAGIAPLAANSSAIREFLANGAGNCALLHFACHGEARQDTTLDANLRMLDAINAEGTPIPDPLTWQDISVHTDFGAGGGPLVFVNACQTGRSGGGISGVAGFAGAFLRPESRHGAAAFIGALWSVDDRLANVFASTVYAGLNAGQPLDDAVAAARKACRDGDDFTWLAYTVYGG